MQSFSDELDDLVVPANLPQSTPNNTSKTNGKATPAPAITSAKPAVPGADDVDFDDEEYLKSEDFLPVVKILRDEVARVALAPGFKLKHAKIHYYEGTGSVRCLSTETYKAPCCAKGAAKDRFVALVFAYSNINKKSGKFATPETKPDIEVKCLRLSRANYKDINAVLEEDQKPDAVDLKFYHDPSRSFGYRFGKIANTPRWHMIREQALALLEPYKGEEGAKKLASRLGKTLTVPELNALLAGKSVGEFDDSDSKLEDIVEM